MATITIPKTIGGAKEFVAVPRGAYEDFLAWQKEIKAAKTFEPTASEKRALARARKNLIRGKFLTLEQLRNELGLANR